MAKSDVGYRALGLRNTPLRLSTWLRRFFFLTWLHMLWLTSGFFQTGLHTLIPNLNSLFNISAWLFYSFLYVSPILLVVCMARVFPRGNDLFSLILALLTSIAVMLIAIADRLIYDLYAFHINGFVLNLLFTPGGVSSLGSGSNTWGSMSALILRVSLLQCSLLGLSVWSTAYRAYWAPRLRHQIALAMTFFVIQAGAYGTGDIKNDGLVLDSAGVYPFFHRITFRSLAGHFGIEPAKRETISAKVDTSRLNYPLKQVRFGSLSTPPNIVILVAESLRWDQMNPEVMPNSWAFAQKAQNFTHHYSSGNGTREALFGMFYGLYGSYWKNFLHAQRSPLLMDRIMELGYDLDIRTSARFSYPEFDKTLFAGVPLNRLHEADNSIPPWQRDERNTTELINFLSHHKSDKPFFSFYFLESTHASYSFPESSAIRKPYMEQLDYANISRDVLMAHRTKLLNRYSNAAHWVDVQLGRIYQALEQKGLLKNTIVIVTGDHGEEFLEHGAWGHNSSFVQEQVRVPLVVSMPGEAPSSITKTTSHMDIATTLLQVLGATGDTRQYSLGEHLFDAQGRRFITISDWHSIAVMTEDLKYRIPYLNRGADHWSPTSRDDHTLSDDEKSALVAREQPLILQAMENCTLYSKL